MENIYTVREAANQLGVSTTTVRRLADEFAEHLPDFHPLPGQHRKLTDADLRTMSAITTRLRNSPGRNRAALLAELTASGSEPLIIPATLPPPSPANSQDSPGSAITGEPIPESLPGSPDTSPAFLAVRNELERMTSVQMSEVARLSAEVEQIKRQASRPAQTDVTRPLAIAAAIGGCILLASIAAAAFTGDITWTLTGSVLVSLLIMAALAYGLW